MHPKLFIQTVVGCFTAPKTYLRLINTSWWFTFRFFVISSILISVVMSLRITYREVPKVKERVSAGLQQAVEYYPSQLEIVWDGTAITTNQDEPVIVPYPNTLEFDQDLLPSNLMTLFPEAVAESELSTTGQAGSLFAVAGTQLYVQDTGNNWHQFPVSQVLAEWPPQTVTDQNIDQVMIEANQYFDQIIQAAIPYIFLISPLVLVVTVLFGLAADVVIAYLIIRLNSFTLSFSQVVKLSFYITVVASTVHQLGLWLYDSLSLPLLTVTFWVVMGYVLLSQRHKLRQKA